MKRLLAAVLAVMTLWITPACAWETAFPAALTHSVGLTGEACGDDAIAALGAALLLCDLSLAEQLEAYDVVFNCTFMRGTSWLVTDGERWGVLAVDESCETLVLYSPASGEISCCVRDGGSGIDAAEQIAQAGLVAGEYDSVRPLDPFMTLKALMQLLDTLAEKAGLTTP